MRPPSKTALLPLTLALACSLVGCGDSPPDGPNMPLEQVLASLVQDQTFREVLWQNDEAPVSVATVAPQSSSSADSGPLPALLLPPAAQVRFRLGSLGSSYKLQFAVGFDVKAFEGEDSGRVRFRCTSHGETLFEALRPFGANVGRAEQTWQRASIDLADIDQFTIETELVQGKGLPPAAFASLEIVAESQRTRERASKAAPNIVLIVIDTLRFDRLGCYGNGRGLTPHLDALAKRGTLFEHALSAAPWTWPSTASILTGLTPAEHGVISHEACYLADELPTLAEALQQAGWTTAGFSGNPLISPNKAFDQGFEEFQAYEWEHSTLLVDDALAWLARVSEWRFLLYMQFIDPHDYRPADAPKAKFAGQQPEGFSRAKTRKVLAKIVMNEPYDEQELQTSVDHLSDIYDASVSEVDAEIGRLIEDLEARGLLDETIFVVTSDHGEEFLDHGLLYHGSQLYHELVGVPLILAGPGIPVGRRVAERVENRHVASTLLELCDVDAQDGLRGVNLLDSQARKTAARGASFLTTSLGVWPQAEGPAWRGVTIHGLELPGELFLWVPEGPQGQSAMALFDLWADPDAKNNIASDREEHCETLRRQIEGWLELGAAQRPDVMGGGADALERLRKLGYVDR